MNNDRSGLLKKFQTPPILEFCSKQTTLLNAGSIILFKQLYNKLKYSPVVIYVSLLIVLLMSPIFYFVWMGLNSGNSNFFYAIGLVLNLLEIVIISDFLWSKIQIEYYEENNLDFTKDSLRLTQIWYHRNGFRKNKALVY